MNTIQDLLLLLTKYGGVIKSAVCITNFDLLQAKASGRFFVNTDLMEYVWIPEIMDFPTTDQEVEFFDKWYPLHTDLQLPPDFCENIFKQATLIDKAKQN